MLPEGASLLWLLLSFGLTALANWQLVETYHHGSIFEQTRARLESRRDWLSELSDCAFCHSHWTALFLSALSFTFFAWERPLLPTWLLFPVYVLAVIRASQWLNDKAAPYCRTPNRRIEEYDHVEYESSSTPEEPPESE